MSSSRRRTRSDGRDIVITNVDIDNLLRAKAAIYAGFLRTGGERRRSAGNGRAVLIGGSFGKYINVEKAVEIGLLPDMPWDRFRVPGQHVGARGRICRCSIAMQRDRVKEIAARMTYIELSADNTFYEAFMSALVPAPHRSFTLPDGGSDDVSQGGKTMYIIGENIHIISDKVKEALKERDAKFFQELAVKQVEAGAQALDLNLGPRKKDWEEVFPWMVETVEAVVDVPLSFDSTNILGIEAGLKKITKAQPIINSTSAEPERLGEGAAAGEAVQRPPGRPDDGASGIPVGADERVNIAIEDLIPRMLEIDYPISDLIIDPLVLTVSGCQEYCPHLIEAVRTLRYAWDPPPAISVGLSNVSNAVPAENRPLINRVYCAMLMGVGLQMMIADPLDEQLEERHPHHRRARRPAPPSGGCT